MPIYEYRCKKCGEEFEKIRKFSDPPLKTHEKCGGALELLLSSPAIQFKGSGFYITDYARKSTPSEASKPGSAGDGGSKAGDGGSKAGEGGSKATDSASKTGSSDTAGSKVPAKTKKTG